MLKVKNLTFGYVLISSKNLFCLFSPFMKTPPQDIKNLKISKQAHQVLKNYCDKHGVKMYRFLENLIYERCGDKKDIYGED